MFEWSPADKIVTALGILTILFFPLLVYIPVVNYVAQTGAMFAAMYLAFRRRAVILIAGALASLIMASSIFGFSLLLCAMWGSILIPATVMGWLLSAGAPTSRTFVIAALFSVAATMIMFWPEKDLYYNALNQAYEYFENGLTVGSLSQARIAEAQDMMQGFVTLIKRLLPSLMALSAVAQLFVGWVGLIILFKSLNEYAPSFRNFLYWKMPEYYIYGIGVFLLIRLLGNEVMKIVADNVILFIGFFYAIFGFSVLEYYLKKIRLSLFLRILFYIGILLLQVPGLILAALVGFADSYFDFRKVKARLIG